MSSADSSRPARGDARERAVRIAAWAQRLATRRHAAAAALVAVAAFAHRGLMVLHPLTALDVPLSQAVDEWFFEPSDTSPVLVMLFVAWLLFRRREPLLRSVGQRGAPAVTAALFATGLGVFFWSMRTGAYDLQALALFFELLGAAHAFGGMRALRITTLPAACLIFAVPLPAPLQNAIIWKFQTWTANYTGALLHLLGVPALVSGDQILRPNQVFQIIESCSGLRTTVTLLMLTILMNDLFRRRGGHALVMVAVAAPVAFAVNGFRALTLVFNPYSNVATIHSLQGIVMLLAGILFLYGLDGVLERLPQKRSARALPEGGAESTSAASRSAPWLVVSAVVAALALLSVGLDRWQLPPLLPQTPSALIQPRLDGWRGKDAEPDRMFLGLASFSEILDRVYVRGRQRVNAFVGIGGLGMHYRSFYSPKTELPTTGWIVEEQRRERRDGRDLDVLVARKGAVRLLIHHWRLGSGSLLAETFSSALALDHSPFRRSELPVVVRLATPVGSGESSRKQAEERLERFAKLLSPALKRMGIPKG